MDGASTHRRRYVDNWSILKLRAGFVQLAWSYALRLLCIHFCKFFTSFFFSCIGHILAQRHKILSETILLSFQNVPLQTRSKITSAPFQHWTKRPSTHYTYLSQHPPSSSSSTGHLSPSIISQSIGARSTYRVLTLSSTYRLCYMLLTENKTLGSDRFGTVPLRCELLRHKRKRQTVISTESAPSLYMH